MPNLNDYHNYKNSGGGSNNGGGSGCDLDRKKKKMYNIYNRVCVPF